MARWSAQDLARVAGNLREHVQHPLAPVNAPVESRPQTFGTKPVSFEGYQFDSQLEAKRYGELKLLQKAGAISKLEIHRRWGLHVNNIKIGEYEADFTYLEGNQVVIEDTKGVSTPLYRWKKKHVLAEYNIEIREIKA